MSESYIERASREGPLPKVDDDSELVGEDSKNAGDKLTDKNTGGVAEEHGADYVTLPSPGVGAFPVPTASGADEADEDDERSPADQEADR